MPNIISRVNESPIYWYIISDQKSYADFFAKHSVKEEDAEMYEWTLLQKAAHSTCIIKNTFLLEKVMDAKQKNSQNLYFSK